MTVVNVAEELVVSGVLHAAEQLQGAVLAAESGCVESLRWAGALPLLLRDLGVRNVLAAERVLGCASASELRVLLCLDEGESVDHLVLLLNGFLWDFEAALKRLLALGVAGRVTVCSSLSERAHKCYDFGPGAAGARTLKAMKFEDFATELGKSAVFPTQNGPEMDQAEEDWEWGDAESDKKRQVEQVEPHNGVQVVHLPLNVVPLLSNKTPTPEPSVFVLSHPTCAAAFPLLLHQVEDVKATVSSPVSPTNRGAAMMEGGNKKYTHVKDVLPEHIPSAFRRSMRLLAYTLAEMLVGANLDAKDRIFAVGATSLKIGHTLLRILNEMQEDASAQSLQGRQGASLVIVDRTSDLASPCAFGSSLLDRILSLLPQTPTQSAAGQVTAEDSASKRANLNVTEIFPLHGCEPTPLSVSAPLTAALDDSSYRPSEFVSQIQWKGGASLCHPTIPTGANVFRSLAFRPAKLALRDLDKRLQVVEQSLLQQKRIQKTAVTRRPGEKMRGRDVVLRRISKILEAGEPTNLEHSSLIELGVIVLETLERMDKSQKLWDKCRERAVRQLELRKQGGREWIIPEVADVMQRQVSAMQAGDAASIEETIPQQELLILLVHAFALSSGVPLEDFTVQMVQKALVESVLQAARTNPGSVEIALPQLFSQLSPYMSLDGSHAERVASEQETTESDDWDWNDGSNSPTASNNVSNSGNSDFQLLAAKPIVETYVESLMERLKDCMQQFVNISAKESALKSEDSPSSLIAQLCSSIVDPSGAPIPGIEHIVDASEQLTRAGIDLLKSGFSKFGFGVGGGNGSGQRGTNASRLLGDSNVLVVFVVGGITFEEIQEVHDALSDNTKYQIILGGTTITNSEVIMKKLIS